MTMNRTSHSMDNGLHTDGIDQGGWCPLPGPPTVLNVSQNYFIRGGSDRYFFQLTELLEQNGHRVIPFSSNQPANVSTSWSHYFPTGVNFEQPRVADLARFIYSRPAAAAIRRMLDDQRPDVAHLHIYYGQLTGSILGPLEEAGVPIVQTSHDFKLVCPVYSLMSGGEICEACNGKHFWKAVTKRCNRGSLARSALSAVETYVSHRLGAVDRIDRIVAVSDFQRNKLVELGVPAEKLVTVHNYKDVRGIDPSNHTGEHFIYFGRIERLKGVLTLIEAASRVRDVPLLLVGTGEASNEVADLIRERGLRHVQLLGFRQGEELERLVRRSIASILPSEGYDNCPMAVLESLAWGRAVIGSRIGGIPELITDGRDGYLFEPRDADALADHMSRLAAQRKMAVDMGHAGHHKIRTEFSPERHYEHLAAVYRDVLKTSPAPQSSTLSATPAASGV